MEPIKKPIETQGGVMATILSFLVRIDWFNLLIYFFPSLQIPLSKLESARKAEESLSAVPSSQSPLPPAESARNAEEPSPSFLNQRNIFANEGDVTMGDEIDDLEVNSNIDGTLPSRPIPTKLPDGATSLMANRGSVTILKKTGSLKVNTTINRGDPTK